MKMRGGNMRKAVLVLCALACPAVAVRAAELVKVIQDAKGYNSWPMIQAVNGKLCCSGKLTFMIVPNDKLYNKE